MKTLLTLITLMLLVSIGTFSLFAVPLAPENPYPANNATGVRLQDLRLSWSHTSGQWNQPFEYELDIRTVAQPITGYTYKFSVDGTHYYLSSGTATWTDAKTLATNNNWRLGCPYTESINNSMQANNEGVNTIIGLTDRVNEGTWRWENGRAFSYSRWRSGEPNDAGGEDFVGLYSNGEWNDYNGGGSHRYWIEVDGQDMHRQITGNNYFDLNCKLAPNTQYRWGIRATNLNGNGPWSTWYFTTGNDGSAPSSYPTWGTPNNEAGPADPLNPTLTWAAVDGATYYKLYVFRSRSRLGTLVAFINGHVYNKTTTTLNYADSKAAIEADGGHLVAINSADEQAMLPNDEHYWIGFTDAANEHQYIWNVGEPSGYTNWDITADRPEPNGQLTENHVIQRQTSRLWHDVSATSTLRSLSEYPADILDGVVVYGTSYSFREHKLPTNTLYRWIAVPYNEYGRPFFQSGQRSFWTTNSPGTAPGTISSAGISPANGATGVPINPTLTWNAPSGSPTEYYAYLGTNNTIGNAGNYTDFGVWNGHRYYRSNHGYDWHWTGASVQAQKDGGYLAATGSSAENNLFGSDQHAWLGGTRRPSAHLYKWTNGSPWSYTNWAAGEPNNTGGRQYHTLRWTVGTWDDHNDNALSRYLVEVAPNIADGARLTTNSYTPDLLRFSTTYYWSAVGSNNAGMASDTQRWSFTTADGKAINPSPAHTSIRVVTNKTFTWDAVAGASGYKFYLGTASGNWNLVNGEACPVSSYTYAGTLDPLTYYWRVETVTPLETVLSNIWNYTAYDYPQDEGVQIIAGTVMEVSGGSANDAINPDPMPPYPNPAAVPIYANTITMYGAGPWTITFTTDAALGIWYSYVTASWTIVHNAGGVITFEIPAGGKDIPEVPIALGDQTLPVVLSTFNAVITSQYFVHLTWVTQSESQMAGYYVLRALEDNLSSAVMVSPMIPASNSSQATSYHYTDQEVQNNQTYFYWLEAVEFSNTSNFFGPLSILVNNDGDVPPPQVDLVTDISRIYPNPFSPQTTIEYTLRSDSPVSISVFNTKGQLIRTLMNDNKASGIYHLEWDGKDQNGALCASGVYVIRMQADLKISTRKVILIK
ncbi:MAG: T9SS type A sorting domain-containing protein [Candidatus Cloacimonetes bacterium]|nr:T9SS type A sorting domain-containing protein [Candidatus Cloacimonadota bacterium]